MNTVVLASYVPGDARFRSKKHRVIGIPCLGDHDYCDGWRKFWQTDSTIVNIEHDMECSDELVDELLDCPHPFCTYAYMLYPVTTGKPAHYAQATRKPHNEVWVAEGTEWCGFSGIGLCKISSSCRVLPLAQRHWAFVDLAVSEATDGRVHVHWPAVEHYHQ